MMNIRNLINLLLLAIVVVLVTVVFLEPGREQAAEPQLSTLDSNSISSITIKRSGLRTIILEKRESTWHMLQPYRAVANTERIDSLLTLPQAKVRTSFPAADRKLRHYDLAEPKATIEFDEEKFTFGSVEHISKHRFILYKDTITLTTDRYYHHLRTSAGQFVSPALLPMDNKIVGLDLPDLKIVRNDKSAWEVMPVPTDTSSDAANILIANWQTARALFVNDHDGTVSDKQAVVHFDNNTSLRFDIFIEEDKLSLVNRNNRLKYIFYSDKTSGLLQLPTPAATTRRWSRSGGSS